MIAALLCAIIARATVLLLPSAKTLPMVVATGVLAYGISIRILRALPTADGDQLLEAAAMLPRLLRGPVTRIIRFMSP